MYVEAVVGRLLASQTTKHVAVLLQEEGVYEWSESVFHVLWSWLVASFKLVWSWLVNTLPALFLRVFEISTAWTFQAFWDAYCFVRSDPHPFHILGWAIFFGPIILLVPFLLLLELLILFSLYLSFLLHGLSLGAIEDRFDALKEYFTEWREAIFANIEHWTATFNKWTTDYPPLLILRLLAGAMSLFILFGLWTGWQ